jgi:DNA-binding CsgD family transcriptional regulator
VGGENVFFLFNNRPYIAIIGDMIDSKKISNRFESQKKLKDVLNDVNAIYSNDIESKLMITLGDEFQGLLKSGSNVISIIEYIQYRMYPIHFRFGIGIGKIETEINQLVPFGADGSAYHHARDMITQLKNEQKKNKTSNANIKIASDDNNEGLELLLNTILSLCTTISQRWTARQREIAFESMFTGENQREIAARLCISQSAVYKLLSKADYYTYKNAMDTVSQILKNIQVK